MYSDLAAITHLTQHLQCHRVDHVLDDDSQDGVGAALGLVLSGQGWCSLKGSLGRRVLKQKHTREIWACGTRKTINRKRRYCRSRLKKLALKVGIGYRKNEAAISGMIFIPKFIKIR
jgi:hypothetical protein